jgi:type 1 glutamine amidotransferase
MSRLVARLAAIGLAGALFACGNGTAPTTQPPVTTPPAQPPPGVPAARLLVVSHTTGFRHDSIPAAEAVIRQIGLESGLFQTEFCRTADDVRSRLTTAGLASVDAVFFANTTGNLGIPSMTDFLAWIAGGKAFLGAHSASDTYHDSPEFLAMLGGEFTTHGAIVEADVRVNDSSNLAVAHLAPSFRIADEWYRFRLAGPGRTVLLSFDRNPADGVGAAGAPADLPIAWQKSHGTGRVFYTAMGHQSEVWQDGRFRRHLTEAIRWALAR